MSDLDTPPVGLEDAVLVESWDALDAVCRAAGVVGDTYPTGKPGYGARRACAVVHGVLLDAPATFNGTRGSWPWPGGTAPLTRSRDRLADQRAEHENERRLRGFDDAIDSVDSRLYGRTP